MWSIWTGTPPDFDQFSVGCYVIEMLLAGSGMLCLVLAGASHRRRALPAGSPPPRRRAPRRSSS